MTRAVVIPTDTAPYVADVDDRTPGVLQALVGGYFEAIPVRRHEAVVFVNEDGVRLRLPPNPHTHPLGWSLVGTAVVFGPADSEGELTDVPQSVIDLYGLGGSDA